MSPYRQLCSDWLASRDQPKPPEQTPAHCVDRLQDDYKEVDDMSIWAVSQKGKV